MHSLFGSANREEWGSGEVDDWGLELASHHCREWEGEERKPCRVYAFILLTSLTYFIKLNFTHAVRLAYPNPNTPNFLPTFFSNSHTFTFPHPLKST